VLVLSRVTNEGIMIGDDIRIVVVDAKPTGGGKYRVRLGIDAPTDVPVHRDEVYREIQRNRNRESK